MSVTTVSSAMSTTRLMTRVGGWKQVGVSEVSLIGNKVHIHTSLEQRLHSPAPVHKLDTKVEIRDALDTNTVGQSVTAAHAEVEKVP